VQNHKFFAQHDEEIDVEQQRQNQHPDHESQQQHIGLRPFGPRLIMGDPRFGKQRHRMRPFDPHHQQACLRGNFGQRQLEHRAFRKGLAIGLGKARCPHRAISIERVEGDRVEPRNPAEKLARRRCTLPAIHLKPQPDCGRTCAPAVIRTGPRSARHHRFGGLVKRSRGMAGRREAGQRPIFRRRRSDDEHRQQHSRDTQSDQKAQSCHAAMPTIQALTMLLSRPTISEQISPQVMRLRHINGLT